MTHTHIHTHTHTRQGLVSVSSNLFRVQWTPAMLLLAHLRHLQQRPASRMQLPVRQVQCGQGGQGDCTATRLREEPILPASPGLLGWKPAELEGEFARAEEPQGTSRVGQHCDYRDQGVAIWQAT